MKATDKNRGGLLKVISFFSGLAGIAAFVYGTSKITAGNISGGLLLLALSTALFSLALDPGFLFMEFPNDVFTYRRAGSLSRITSSLTGILIVLWISGKVITSIFK